MRKSVTVDALAAIQDFQAVESFGLRLSGVNGLHPHAALAGGSKIVAGLPF
jgi:hypothetical protein